MPTTECFYAEMAVAAPVHQTLTYAVPRALAGSLVPGVRALVPLGRQLVTGYTLGYQAEPPADCKLKEVAEVLDSVPLFPESLIPFYRWLAAYYRYPLGEVIKTALPGGMSPGSGRRILLTAKGKTALPSHEEDLPWLSKLLAKGEISPGTTRLLWRKAKPQRLLKNWESQGLVTIEVEVGKDAVQPKTEFCIRLSEKRAPLPALKPSEEKTLELIRRLSQKTGRIWLARKDLAREYSGARRALRALLHSGLIAGEERPVYRDPFGEQPPFFSKPDQLSAEQTLALQQLLPAIRKNEFAPFLLHGVTGSGKTEVYLRAAEETIAAGRSVLVLVPEIALATQLEGHFLSRFGDKVAILHSGLSRGERFDQWQRLASGEALIVIGARSAIFAPLKDPGLLVVDEEHDSAFKQEDGLRYQARDMAVLRASLQKATVLLGSATPSVASFHHARTGKYRLLSLRARVENRPLPRVNIIDLKGIKTVSGRPPLFSQPLTAALRETLRAGDQSLLFLNRRGFASVLLCRQCGQTLQCRDCQVSLTFHKSRHELLCHYCGYTRNSATVCTNCRSTEFLELGFGTERVEAELHHLFPGARIARLDRDTTVNRSKYLEILGAVRRREIDILVGTQMITKGHHFPHVTLVGVVWADAGLGLPDFKAGERTHQLLSQVTGRTGRGEKPGRVFIQTYQPDHYSVVTAKDHDYFTFFEREIALRRSLQFPPFSRLINLRLEGEDDKRVQTAAQELASRVRLLARQNQRPVLLGPAPAPLARLRGRYRWQLLLKDADRESLHQLCEQLLSQPPSAVKNKKVKLAVDVDPDNML